MTAHLHQKRQFFGRVLAVLCLLFLWTAQVFAEELIVRVTGIPDENPTKLARKYQPMIDFLQKELGAEVTYVPVTDYGAAVSALAADKVDFAWLGGFTYVQARVWAGALPVVMRDIDREFKSVFIAHKDAGIAKVEDFRGKSFAFGSKSSTSGHLMPRHFMLNQLQIDPEKDLAGKPIYSGAHDATVKMVESGKVQGGAVNIEVWERMVEAGKVDTAKVEVVWTTPEYVDYVWAARKGLDSVLTEKFKHAFLKLSPSVPAQKAVLDLQGAQMFVEAVPADFDSIEQVARATGLLK